MGAAPRAALLRGRPQARSSADELGVSKQAQLEQGRIAAEIVAEWLLAFDDPDLDERALAARIPYLPRREDTYPVMAAR